MPDVMNCMEIWGGNQRVDEFIQRPGLAVWVYSQPCKESRQGGDVYYLSSCASGRISRMLLADVSGHGHVVSGFAKRLKDLMRRYINRIQQNLLVEEINREFAEQNHEGRFATALVATFFANNRSLQLSLAGHPCPLLFRNSTRTWDLYDVPTRMNEGPGVRGLAWGISKDAIYGVSQLSLGFGDMILAYTDGLTETRVEDGALLQTEGLLQLIRSFDPDQPANLLPRLLSELQRRATTVTGDDLSLMLVQATETRPTVWDTVLAPARLLGAVRDNTRIQ
jgi:phosphoserine phosphatase RsbU/P